MTTHLNEVRMRRGDMITLGLTQQSEVITIHSVQIASLIASCQPNKMHAVEKFEMLTLIGIQFIRFEQ